MQRQLLQEVASAYGEHPKGLPPYSSQIADTDTEVSFLKSHVDTLVKEPTRLKDTMVTVTETNASMLAQVNALKDELHISESSELRLKDVSETRKRTARKNRLCLTQSPESPEPESPSDLIAVWHTE